VYVSQGAFSYLAELDSQGIWSQINYAKWKWFGVVIEYCEDPHPRNSFWYMWGMPNFDIMDPDTVIYEIDLCQQAFPEAYIKLAFYDCRIGSESCGFSYIARRPRAGEVTYVLIREEGEGRRIRYSIVPSGSLR
jgi:ribulose-bisphosphate carboxylase small chain